MLPLFIPIQVFFPNCVITDTEALTEEVQSVFVENNTAFIAFRRPGFFVNNTNDKKGVTYNWTSGHGK